MLSTRRNYKDDFPTVFRKHFEDKFILLTREQALKEKLWGLGQEHKDLRLMLGDYVAVSVSDAAVFNTHFEAQDPQEATQA